jgi:hypothetical protein
LSPAELEVARRVAADLLAERYAVPSLPPQGVDESVTVHTEPPLTRDVRDTPAQRAAAAWFAGLRTRALQSPLAAFELRVRAQQRPTLPSPTIVVDFVHRGPQSLDLSFDRPGILVRLQPAGGAPSESNAEPVMGLLDAHGALLDGDGIYRTATLSRGTTVSLVLRVPASRGNVEVSVSLSGNVELPGSGSDGAGAGRLRTIGPGTPFRVVSEPVQIEFPP